MNGAQADGASQSSMLEARLGPLPREKLEGNKTAEAVQASRNVLQKVATERKKVTECSQKGDERETDPTQAAEESQTRRYLPTFDGPPRCGNAECVARAASKGQVRSEGAKEEQVEHRGGEDDDTPMPAQRGACRRGVQSRSVRMSSGCGEVSCWTTEGAEPAIRRTSAKQGRHAETTFFVTSALHTPYDVRDRQDAKT